MGEVVLTSRSDRKSVGRGGGGGGGGEPHCTRHTNSHASGLNLTLIRPMNGISRPSKTETSTKNK